MERELTRLTTQTLGNTSESSLQDLLNQEAELCNSGHSDSEERKKLHTIIRLKRAAPAPYCFGDDDCSTLALSVCAWRMDCGV